MTKHTKEILESIIIDSDSIGEVILKLGLKKSGGNYSHIKSKIIKYGISVKHFTRKKHLKITSYKRKRTLEEFNREVLCCACTNINSHSLKLKLYEFKLKGEICEKCSLGCQWNGEKISLHLDHIDGNNKNNFLNNLRILCPNCHSQTETYSGKRNSSQLSKQEKLETLDNHCEDCDCFISRRASKCKSCKNIAQNNKNRNFIIPDKESLIKMLFDSNFTQVGKLFGVTDNAVRKWCIKYNISNKSSDYK